MLGGGDCDTVGSGSMDIQPELTMEQAERILQYLKGNKGKQTRVHADDEGSF